LILPKQLLFLEVCVLTVVKKFLHVMQNRCLDYTSWL